MRAATGFAILAFWLAMMAILASRHLIPESIGGGQSLDIEQMTSDWQDVEEWMRISIKDRPVGIAHSAVRKQDGGYKALSRAKLSLEAAGPKPVSFQSVAVLNNDFHLSSFWISAVAATVAIDVRAVVWEDNLMIKFDPTPGSLKRGYYPLEQPIILMDSLRPLATEKMELAEGATYRFAAFDPMWSGLAGEAVLRVIGPETITIDGREVQATKLETTLAGQKMEAWVDEDHQVLRYQFLNDIMFDRIARAEALREEPSFASEPPVPTLNMDEFTQNQEPIDLSQQSPMSLLSQIFFGAAPAQP